MIKWMLNLPCKVRWHRGPWVYDSGVGQCTRTRICRRCGGKSSRVRHDVRQWQFDESFSRMEIGICIYCERPQHRLKPAPRPLDRP